MKNTQTINWASPALAREALGGLGGSRNSSTDLAQRKSSTESLTIRISKHTTKQTTRELKNEVQNQTRFPPPDAASQLMTSRSNPSVHQLLTQFQTEMVAPPQTRISFWNKKCTPGRNVIWHTPRAEIPRSFPTLDHSCCLHSKPSEDQTQHTHSQTPPPSSK